MNRNIFDSTFDRLYKLAAAALLVAALAAGAAAQAPSADPDNPTPMASNVVTGKSNGKARTHYYSFVATAADPGEVKVKVTASTDERSTNLRVNFLDEDGQQVMDELYLIPKRDPATKVALHTFAERQKVVMRVTLPDDPQVRLLSYKIEVTGAVEFEAAPAAQTETPPSDPGATPPTPDPSPAQTDEAEQGATAQQAGQDSGTQGQQGKSLRRRVGVATKKAGREALRGLLKDNQF